MGHGPPLARQNQGRLGDPQLSPGSVKRRGLTRKPLLQNESEAGQGAKHRLCLFSSCNSYLAPVSSSSAAFERVSHPQQDCSIWLLLREETERVHPPFWLAGALQLSLLCPTTQSVSGGCKAGSALAHQSSRVPATTGACCAIGAEELQLLAQDHLGTGGGRSGHCLPGREGVLLGQPQAALPCSVLLYRLLNKMSFVCSIHYCPMDMVTDPKIKDG